MPTFFNIKIFRFELFVQYLRLNNAINEMDYLYVVIYITVLNILILYIYTNLS